MTATAKPLLDAEATRKLCERVAARSPVPEVEVLVRESDQALTRFACNEITQNVGRRGFKMFLRIQSEGREASAELNQADDASIDRAYERAMAVLRVTPRDESLLPILSEPQDYKPVQAFDEAALTQSPADRARAIGELTRRAAAEQVDAAGRYEVEAKVEAYYNNHGLFAFHPSSKAIFSTTITDNRHGTEGWGLRSAEGPAALDTEAAGEVAIGAALGGRDPATLQPGRFTAILKPAAVGELLLFLSRLTFGGRHFVEKRSFLAGKLGEKVVGDAITIRDNPYDPRMPGRPWDLEGVATRAVTVIDQGTARELCWDRRSALRMGGDCRSTGHALQQPNTIGPRSRNIVMEGEDGVALDDLIRGTDEGLLVSRFHYCNVVNPMEVSITGMTRSGLFEIRGGEVARPVRNFRFTVNLIDLLKRVSALSAPQRTEGALFGERFVAPALRVEGFRMTSVTEF